MTLLNETKKNASLIMMGLVCIVLAYINNQEKIEEIKGKRISPRYDDLQEPIIPKSTRIQQ